MRCLIFFIIFLLSNRFIAQWTITPSPTINNLNSVHFANTNIGFAVGDNGAILKTTDQGSNWSASSSSNTASFSSVHCTNADTVFMSNKNIILLGSNMNKFEVFRTTDGGSNWYSSYSSGNAFPNGQIKCIHSKPPGYVWVSGNVYVYVSAWQSWNNYGIIYGSKNSGSVWNILPCYNINNDGWGLVINSVFFLDSLVGYSCGSSLTSKTINGGKTWIYLNNFNGNSIHFVNNNIGYVAGDNGVIRKTINGGTNWITQNSGTVNNLTSIFFATPDTGCAVGIGGKILGTVDGGLTWHTQVSPTIADLSSVHFTNGKTGFIVGKNGTILKNIGGPISENEISIKKKIESVFSPNPAIDIVEVNCSVSIGVLTVYDCKGKQIKSISFNSNSFKFSINDLASGIYLLKISGENSISIGKLIKE